VSAGLEHAGELLRGRLGRPFLWRETCESTQNLLQAQDLPEGAVAVAEHQTRGRGRQGRTWVDEPGQSLLCSVLLRPEVPAGRLPQLSVVAGLAVAEAVESVAGIRCLVKWPNDVVHGDRKLAGVLVEASEAVICGLGVNVAQPADALPETPWGRATSLHAATGRPHDRALLLVTVLDRLERRYDAWLAGGLAPFGDELAARDWLRGRRVLAGGSPGTADGIADDGRLRVRRDGGEPVLVGSGEVVPLE
jgi:BirA family biotin operon repressor/biotin-[acetyl-CoA-carboxylase] ligase